MGGFREEPAPIATFSTKYPKMWCPSCEKMFQIHDEAFRIAAEFVWGFIIALAVSPFSNNLWCRVSTQHFSLVLWCPADRASWYSFSK